jgi:hypothetical protein
MPGTRAIWKAEGGRMKDEFGLCTLCFATRKHHVEKRRTKKKRNAFFILPPSSFILSFSWPGREAAARLFELHDSVSRTFC